MDSIIRINSEAGNHDLSGNKNLVDFTLPANSGVYSLKDSYVALTILANPTNTAAVGTTGATLGNEGVFAPFVNYAEPVDRINGSNLIVPPTSAVLVKNAQMVCTAKGQVESIRRVDCLRANEYLYVRDEQALQCNPNALVTTHEASNLICEVPQPYVEMVSLTSKTNPVRSRHVAHEVRIPLREIFNIGKEEQWDTAVYGATKIHLEMRLNNFLAGISVPATATTRFRGVGTEDFLGACETNANASGNAVNAFSLMLKNKFTQISPSASPFWTGKKVQISDGEGASVIAVIKSIYVYDGKTGIDTYALGEGIAVVANAGKMVIELDGYYKTIANGAASTNPLIAHYSNGDAAGLNTVTLQKLELVAKKSMDSDAPKVIQYGKYEIEEDSFPVVTDAVFNRYYMVPPMCDSVLVLLADNQTYCTTDYNGAANSAIDRYRVTIDNKEISDRDIQMKSQIHYDNAIKVMNNLGHDIENLHETYLQWNFADSTPVARHRADVILIPVPMSPNSQKLGLEITPEAGNQLKGHVIIAKHHMASI